MQTARRKFDVGMLVHSIIGVSIMLLGRFVPAPHLSVPANEKLQAAGIPLVDGTHWLGITPEGMVIIGLFFGVVYLWTTVDSLWPSFLGVALYGMSSHVPMPQALNQFMGNPMTVMLFFLFMFAAILMRSNISAYLARWFMTHRIVKGRPWAFTAMILAGTYFVAMLEQTTACFLMWPALYVVFDHVGFKRGDRYVTLMIVNTMMMALLSFATDPFKGGAFYLLSNMNMLAAASAPGTVVPLNIASYLIFSLTISAASIGAILFFMRYVYRVDVTPLQRIDPDILKKDELPPFSLQQKLILALFFLYSLWLLLPGIIGKNNPLGAFLAANAMAASMVIIFLASAIRVGGKPLADLPQTNQSYPWRTFVLIATAFLLGGAITKPETNVTLYMEFFLKTHLAGFSELGLTVLIISLAIIVTNFCNSVVAGFIFTPVILALSSGLGFAANPIIACFIFIVLIAAVTPAASPFAAILYDNPDWISRRNVAVNALVSSLVIMGVVIVVGIPLAGVLF
jgi:sodium-dependent dicarboxylate transporter 2/3/5